MSYDEAAFWGEWEPCETKLSHERYSNSVRLVQHRESGKMAVLKRLMVDDGSQARYRTNNEVQGYILGSLIGANIPRVDRLDSATVLVDFVEGHTAQQFRGLVGTAYYPARVQSYRNDMNALFDFVANVYDRHRFNCIVHDYMDFWLIDNERAFAGIVDCEQFERDSFFGLPWHRESLTTDRVRSAMSAVEESDLRTTLVENSKSWSGYSTDLAYRHVMTNFETVIKNLQERDSLRG
ncbi:hypothetical protein [Pseudonocardia oroxyli]|uniref:Uncharacterized protein n=1 Tax=Pseudonocardia oroxyli TaxID=366584 RepID=A0A1G7UL58_PSEOR|nr:hypothetical protein [Pseudonocardia oroxyli]SDG48246.1 hypothetical protein SAMN05216377_11280 [Pseudonocardia oroxyli]